MPSQVPFSLAQPRRRRLVVTHPRTRLRSELQSISSTIDSTMVQPRISHTAEGNNAADVSGRDACERRSRSGQRSKLSGVLFTRLPSHQKEREVQTSHQSPSFESTTRSTIIQDGDRGINLSSCNTRRLGHISRSNRWILPHSHSPMVSEVPKIRDQRQNLPVQSPSVWLSNCTTNIHQDACTDGYTSTCFGHTTTSVHRRHSSQSYKSQTTDCLVHRGHHDSDVDGLQNQPTKVHVRAYPGLCLHRSQVSHSSRTDETTRRQNRQDHHFDSRNQRGGSSSSQDLDVTPGTPRIGRETSPIRTTTHPTSTDLSTLSIPMGSASTRLPDSTQQQMLLGTRVVVRSTECNQGTRPRSFLSRPHSIHRRVIDELGSTHQRVSVLGTVDTSRISTFDQSTRASSCHTCHPSSTSIMEELEDYDRIGQLDSDCVHQQDGWHKKQRTTRTDSSALPGSSNSRVESTSQTHSWSTQQTGRLSFQDSPSSRHRVDTVDASLQTSPCSMGISNSRSDGNVADDSPSSIRVSLSRPESLSSRHNILRLDRTGRIHLSSMADDRYSSTETQTQSLRSNSNHPILAKPTMVSRLPRPVGRTSQTTSSTSRSSFHATQPTSTRKHRSAFSARMQTIIDSAVDQGFSTKVSERIARGRHVNSTQVIYDSKWLKFQNWCSSREIDPGSATVGQLADFLLHLFNKMKLSYSTICGYRSSINSVWRALDRQDVETHAIRQLLDTFRIDRPRAVVVLPKWDLALVLRVLSQPPYEPLESIDFKNLSAKTVFLLLLATSRRRGDIHAIDPKRVTFTDEAAILEPLPNYIPKVRDNAERGARYQPMVVRKLNAITADEAELSLCPVRALLAYEKVASQRTPNRAQFFISTRANSRLVTKNTISAWIVKLIRSAYASASSEDCRLSQTSVHEVRAIAASLAYQATYALNDVLKAATWASPTTFIDHYLRDVTGLQGRLHVIAPCIVAGKTLR